MSGAVIGITGAIGGLGGVAINLVLRNSYLAHGTATAAFWSSPASTSSRRWSRCGFMYDCRPAWPSNSRRWPRFVSGMATLLWRMNTSPHGVKMIDDLAAAMARVWTRQCWCHSSTC